MGDCEFGESLAQEHVFLEFLEDVLVEVEGVREKSIQAPHNGVQVFGLPDRHTRRVVFYVQQH